MANYLNQDGLDKLVELTKQDISGVEEKAESAQTTADQAVTDAATAQTTAEKAQTTADRASTAAATAQTTAEAAQETADEALETANDLYSDSIRPNVIRNTNDINELGSTGTWDAGTWRQVNQSGSTRTSTRIDVTDAPDPHISCGVRCYTASGSTYAKIRQDGVPMEEGAYYTASFYARGSGQAQFQYGMSPYIATNFDVTDDWERYSVGFTFVGADCASTDGDTYIYFGTGSAGTVEICGMMLEKWDEMTDWMPNPLDAKDTTARETADSAASAAASAQSTADSAASAAASAQSTADSTKSGLTDGSVTKVGTSTVGGAAKPIYLSSGTPTACSSTVGSGTQPAYLSSGTITACGTTVGSGTKPIYSSSGTLTASSSTVGSSTNPVYLNSGTVTACSMSDMLVIESLTSSTVSVSAGSTLTQEDVSTAKSGYKALGVVGYNYASGSYSTYVILNMLRIRESTGNLYFALRNTGTGTASVTITAHVLYLKTS